MSHSYPKNHSVTQSSFAGPCSFKEGGFDSGFMPVAANVTESFPVSREYPELGAGS
jgi:hypothetical protein